MDETSLERWVMVMDMLGHIREMDVHFKYSGHSFLPAKDVEPVRFPPYSEEDDEPEDEESEVSSSFPLVILRDVVDACC